MTCFPRLIPCWVVKRLGNWIGGAAHLEKSFMVFSCHSPRPPLCSLGIVVWKDAPLPKLPTRDKKIPKTFCTPALRYEVPFVDFFRSDERKFFRVSEHVRNYALSV